MPNVSQAELARRWGVNRSRITQYKSAGMPVDNAAAAFDWLAANHPDRALAVMEAEHATAEATPDNMITPPPAPAPGKTEETGPAATLARLITVEKVCWLMFKNEQDRNNYKMIDPRAKSHRAAGLARMDAENKLAEYVLKTRQAVQLSEVMELIGKILAPVKSQLNALPYTAAAQANPADEEHARKVLAEAVAVICESITKSLEQLKG